MILLVACIPAVALANGSPAADRFLVIEGAVWLERDHRLESIKTSTLPAEASSKLAHYPWHGYDYTPTIPEEIPGFAIDLNDDGASEYIIHFKPFGGSGGPFFFMLGEIRGHWQEIGSFQGGFALLPLENGWHPIMIISRGGAEVYSKTCYVFRSGTYQELWIEQFDHGKITKKSIEPGGAPDAAGAAPGDR